MVGWNHWPDVHEFNQAPRFGDGQGSLICCSPWGHKELDMTERLNWAELRSHSYFLFCGLSVNITCYLKNFLICLKFFPVLWRHNWHTALCKFGLFGWLSGKESACQWRRFEFDLWAGKISWRGKWQPTSVFLTGKFHGQRNLVGYIHRVTMSQTWLSD